MFRSFAVLIIALSFVVGPGWFVPIAVECPRCADYCPMKKPRLTCHSEGRSHLPCHSGPRFSNAACSHGAFGLPPAPEVALLVPPVTSLAPQRTAPLSTFIESSPQAPTLDPPLDPPRSRLAV